VEVQYIAYLFAIATGVVTSGAIASLWVVITDEAPHFRLLTYGDVFAPLRVPIVVLSAPTSLFAWAWRWMNERLLLSVLTLLCGIAWSFFQGVFILTQIFGVT
jgi:hypothetical protein